MVNRATGEAASPSRPTVLATGSISARFCHENTAPKEIAQGIGLRTTPARALRAATAAPCSPAASSRDRAMHKEVVNTMSTRMVTMAGPAAAGPSSATSSGTPMKPVLGKAATRAPKDASFQRMRSLRLTATLNATIRLAHSKYVKNTPASSSCAIGVLAPKRNSMHGSAKNSTKPFRPGMAGKGRKPFRAAR